MMNEKAARRLLDDINTGRGQATAPTAPVVTQAQITAIRAVLSAAIDTAMVCDGYLADDIDKVRKNVTAQDSKIAALEEAICPRVAARLDSLEKAVIALQGLAITKPADPVFYICGVPYTAEEGDVARMMTGGAPRSAGDWQRARTVIKYIRGT